MKRVLVSLFILICFAGCSSIKEYVAPLKDYVTPPLSVTNEDFEGATMVRQPPVSASNEMSEGWNVLGFEWSSKSPDLVFIIAGTKDPVNVVGVEFNADGEVVKNVELASENTEHEDWSTRRFSIPWTDFLAIANAQLVTMKIKLTDAYSVSSFGPKSSKAVVNAKIAPFVEKVEQFRAAN